MKTVLDKPSPTVVKTPGVLGGKACLAHTRIPVFVIVNWKKLGWSDAEILDTYPDLCAEDLNVVWEYYASHTAEIDADIEGNERWIRE